MGHKVNPLGYRLPLSPHRYLDVAMVYDQSIEISGVCGPGLFVAGGFDEEIKNSRSVPGKH